MRSVYDHRRDANGKIGKIGCLDHLATSGGSEVVLLLTEASLLELTGLFVGRVEAVLLGLLINLFVSEVRKLLGGSDVRHLLEVTLGEDEIDLLKRTTSYDVVSMLQLRWDTD